MFKYVPSLALGSYAPESYIGVEPTRKWILKCKKHLF